MTRVHLKGKERMRKDFDEWPRFLLPVEACELLRISKASFYKKAFLGQLPVTKVGGSIRVDKHKLMAYLENRTRGGEK